MRRIDKFLLSVISLICCVGSICIMSLIYYIPYITELAEDGLIAYPLLKDVLMVVCLLIAVCFLLLLLVALFSPVKVSSVYFKRGKGNIYFSKQAIESSIRYSYSDIEGINSSRIRTKLNKNPEKTRIFVKLSVSDYGKTADLTATVQEKIESAMRQSFGLEVRSISLEVVEITSVKTNGNEERGESRVI